MLAVLTLIAAVVFLRFTRGLMIPIVIAVLISCAAAPLVVWLDRLRVPRWAGAGFVVLAIAGGLGWGVLALGDELAVIVERLPEALNRLRQSIASQGGLLEPFANAFDGSMSDGLVKWGPAGAVALAGDLTVIVFLVYFLLFAGDRYAHLVASVASRPMNRKITSEILGEIYSQIRRFLLVTLFTSAIVGVSTWALLLWVGIEQAAFWAVMAGVFNMIPYFGPVIISGGLAVVAMMQGGVAQAVWVSAGALAITSIEGWLITPPLMGRAERMNVIAVFLGLLVWSWIWGVWGTILAVPMLAIIKAVADHVHPLQPVGELLGELPERR